MIAVFPGVEMSNSFPCSLLLEISCGTHEIGNESIPNAAPRHNRLIRKPVWILAVPFEWSRFEMFVMGGGFATESVRLGFETKSKPLVSVDQRVQQLLAESLSLNDDYPWNEYAALEQPLTGTTWHEANTISSFFGARLPSEIEWEVGMQQLSLLTDEPTLSRNVRRHHDWIQEWTADAYSPRYWRADFEKTCIPWQPGSSSEIAIRGSAPGDIHKHVCCRKGGTPDETSPWRGFRLAWDELPADAVLINSIL